MNVIYIRMLRPCLLQSPVAVVPEDMSEEGAKPLWDGEEAGRKGMVLIPGKMAQVTLGFGSAKRLATTHCMLDALLSAAWCMFVRPSAQ